MSIIDYRKEKDNFFTPQFVGKIPALDDMTPRVAAADPQMRPRLIELMKQHLKGIERQNKDRELGLNIDWVLDELSLPELK